MRNDDDVSFPTMQQRRFGGEGRRRLVAKRRGPVAVCREHITRTGTDLDWIGLILLVLHRGPILVCQAMAYGTLLVGPRGTTSRAQLLLDSAASGSDPPPVASGPGGRPSIELLFTRSVSRRARRKARDEPSNSSRFEDGQLVFGSRCAAVRLSEQPCRYGEDD